MGTSFMKEVNLDKTVKVGQKVVVIGGGNVALDCARSARRLGATEVRVACLECREDMPAETSETEQAEEEGIQFHPSCTSSQILGGGGKVSGVECLEVTGLRFDQDGRPDFDVVKDSQHTLPADMVIFAVGQTPGLDGAGEIETGRLGTIVADTETLMLSRPGVFVAGDCFSGVTSIIDAIASGQKAAFYINRYLQGDVLRVRPKPAIRADAIKVEVPPETEKQERQSMPLLPVAERLSNFKEVALGFSPEAAMAEAKRCLNCAGHLCKDVCPYAAPQFAEEEKARMQKCDLCLERWAENKKPICVEGCPVRALDAGPLDELKAKYGAVSAAHGFVYSKVAEPSVVSKPKCPQTS